MRIWAQGSGLCGKQLATGANTIVLQLENGTPFAAAITIAGRVYLQRAGDPEFETTVRNVMGAAAVPTVDMVEMPADPAQPVGVIAKP